MCCAFLMSAFAASGVPENSSQIKTPAIHISMAQGGVARMAFQSGAGASSSSGLATGGIELGSARATCNRSGRGCSDPRVARLAKILPGASPHL